MGSTAVVKANDSMGSNKKGHGPYRRWSRRNSPPPPPPLPQIGSAAAAGSGAPRRAAGGPSGGRRCRRSLRPLVVGRAAQRRTEPAAPWRSSRRWRWRRPCLISGADRGRAVRAAERMRGAVGGGRDGTARDSGAEKTCR
jgi:hypothetical protein